MHYKHYFTLNVVWTFPANLLKRSISHLIWNHQIRTHTIRGTKYSTPIIIYKHPCEGNTLPSGGDSSQLHPHKHPIEMQCWNLSWNDGCSVAQSGVLQIPTHLWSGSWRVVSFSRRDRRASGEDLGCCLCGPVASEENRQVYAKRHTLGFIKVKDWSVLPTNPHCKKHLLWWEFNDVYACV